MASPHIDPEAGCVVPEEGEWPVDPQHDVPIKEDRLWIDGCFDFFHHGHAGVMLQSRRFGDELFVGIHTDAEIAANKGPTVMNLAERVAAVDACRFASRCVPAAPYVTSIPWITHYGCKYVTHGDDITSDANGEDCYRFVKKAGRMKIVPRTPGISTTDLVGRMLDCSREHWIRDLVDVMDGREGGEGAERRAEVGAEMWTRLKEYAAAPNGLDPFVQIYNYTEPPPAAQDPKGTFTSLIAGQAPRPGQRLVYVDGGFDLFSSGHIAFLQTVSQLEETLGEARGWSTPAAIASRKASNDGADYAPAYIVAGVHADGVVNAHRGVNYPIMNLYERGLCVVQCAYIHGVVFGAPYSPSKPYLETLPFGGRVPDAVYRGPTAVLPDSAVGGGDPYAAAKALDIFEVTPQHAFADVNAAQIVGRILGRRGEYEDRQRKKGVKGVGEQAHRRREMEEEQARRLEERGV